MNRPFVLVAGLVALLMAGTAFAQEPSPTPTTGTLTVCVDTDPETNDGPGFDYDLDPGSDINDIEDDECASRNLSPGDYNLSQDPEDGWVLTDISCSGSEDVVIDDDLSHVEITVTNGDVITCRFDNEPVPATPTAVPPSPTATPQVIIVPGPTQIVERIVEKRPAIKPPSTGDAGIK